MVIGLFMNKVDLPVSMGSMAKQCVSESTRAENLDPFALPTETYIRYQVLVASAVALICFVAGSLPGLMKAVLGVSSTQRNMAMKEEVLKKGLQHGPALLSESRSTAIHDFLETLTQFGWMLIFFAVVSAVTYALLRVDIRRERRLWNLQPLEAHSDKKFVASVHDLLASVRKISPMGLPPLSVEVEKGRMSQGHLDAKVFGSKSMPIVALTSGVRLEFYKQHKKFKARILHELAHVASGDAYRERLVRILWGSVFIFLVMPILTPPTIFILLNFDLDIRVRLSRAGFLIFQGLGTWAIVMYARASMIRVREFYADWMVKRWDPETGTFLADHWGASTEKDLNFFQRLWGYHPTVQERHAALDDPARLFKIKNDLLFVAGALLAYLTHGVIVAVPALPSLPLQAGMITVLPGVTRYFNEPGGNMLFMLAVIVLLFIGVLLSIFISAFVLLGASYPIAGILGAQVQRQAMADLAVGKSRAPIFKRMVVPALLFTSGFEVAFQLTPLAGINNLPLNRVSAVAVVFTFMALAMAIWFWLSYVYISSRSSLGKHVSSSSLGKKRGRANILSALMLLSLLSPALLFRIRIPFLNPGMEPLQVQLLFSLFVRTFFVGLVCLVGCAIVLFSTWIWNYGGLIFCPQCATRTRHRYAVGSTCEACASPLAPWLYR